MKNIVAKVKPIIIYQKCILFGGKQNCFECSNKLTCNSPRSFCIHSYHNHPKGCPNYGKKNGCPPNVPMFDEVFDINQDIYAIITSYDLKSHLEYMKEKHPEWSEFQIRNSRYWQGTDRKNHLILLKEFIIKHPSLFVTAWGEAMGIDICETLKQMNINLEFPPKDETYRVSFAGNIISKDIEKEYEINNKILVKRLY